MRWGFLGKGRTSRELGSLGIVFLSGFSFPFLGRMTCETVCESCTSSGNSKNGAHDRSGTETVVVGALAGRDRYRFVFFLGLSGVTLIHRGSCDGVRTVFGGRLTGLEGWKPINRRGGRTSGSDRLKLWL